MSLHCYSTPPPDGEIKVPPKNKVVVEVKPKKKYTQNTLGFRNENLLSSDSLLREFLPSQVLSVLPFQLLPAVWCLHLHRAHLIFVLPRHVLLPHHALLPPHAPPFVLCPVQVFSKVLSQHLPTPHLDCLCFPSGDLSASDLGSLSFSGLYVDEKGCGFLWAIRSESWAPRPAFFRVFFSLPPPPPSPKKKVSENDAQKQAPFFSRPCDREKKIRYVCYICMIIGQKCVTLVTLPTALGRRRPA